jgi:hypothetical protein
MIYLCRKSPIFYKAYGNAHLFVVLHTTKTLAFGFYWCYCLWALQRDVVTLDLLYMRGKLRYTRMVQLSFRAKLYLYFGQTSLIKAMIWPCLGPLPLNGVEFEHEAIQSNISELDDTFKVMKLSD